MGWGEPTGPRPHEQGGMVIEVAAADHLAAVEAERDRYRQAIGQALDQLAEHPLTGGIVPECATCRARRILTDAIGDDE